MHKPRIICLYLDGTLLDGRKRISARKQRALQSAADAGIEIVPATGRFYLGIPEQVRNLPFIHYAITINGAAVWDLQAGRALLREELPWQKAAAIMTQLDALPVIYDCYLDDWGWMSQAHYDRAADFAPHRHSLEMLRKFRTPVPELKAHLARLGHGVQKLQAFFLDPALRARTMAELAGDPELAVSSSIPRNMELNSRDAQKGEALLRLAALLGIAREETVAFGDDLNDVSMLKAAGLGVAMGNASAEARAAADIQTASCDENGVARTLATLLDV